MTSLRTPCCTARRSTSRYRIRPTPCPMAEGSTKSRPRVACGAPPSREASPRTVPSGSSATTIRRAVTSSGRIRSSAAHAARKAASYPQCALDRITSPVRASASAGRAALTFTIR